MGPPWAGWEDSRVGYWRTRASATEMQISAYLEKVWPWNDYAVSLQHTLTPREVLVSLKTHWPIMASRWTCQSGEEDGSSGCCAASSALLLSRLDWFRVMYSEHYCWAL